MGLRERRDAFKRHNAVMPPKRPTTGRYGDKTPGLPNTDPKRADARLRDFSRDTEGGTEKC